MTRRASEAVRAALRGHDPSDEQWAAIFHPAVPLAIIAGAGSGKTAVMAARVVWLTEEAQYTASQILGLTFTNKAAGELETRIDEAFRELDPVPNERPHIATYNAFADSLLREHGVRIGIDPEVGLLSEAQRWQLLLACFDSLPPFDAVDSRSPASICRSVLGLADSCGNHLVTPERLIEEDERVLREANQFPDDVVVCSRRRIELARVVRAYTDAKVKARRIDFGDQVTRAVEIMEDPTVAAELRARYPAVLLDEYQDTNVAQRRLIQLLAPTGHNVTAVGDARQNIFQWRGSTLFNLIDFPTKHFLRAGATGATPHEYLTLSENFRSGRRILEVANRVIDRVPAQRRPGEALRAHPGNGEGWVGVKLTADQEDEASFIADEIERQHGPGAAGGTDTPWSQFAVLVRRKSHIRPIHDALRARGIPVDVVGLAGLLQVPEVLDTIAWLRVLADPGPMTNRWLARILLGPRFRIHYRDLTRLARWAASQTRELTEARRGLQAAEEGTTGLEAEPDEVAYSLSEVLDHLSEVGDLGPQALARLERARDEIAALRGRTGEPLADLVQAVMRESGVAEALETAGQGASVNLTGFLGVVAGFAPVSGDPSLPAFLAYLDAAEEVEETLEVGTPSGVDSVKLMTVHQAKGLEFDTVFVPGVAARTNEKDERVDSIFPDERTANPMTSQGQLPHLVREDAGHLPNPWQADGRPRKKAELQKELKERAVEDERRLFYVALTRARKRLYVTAAWWYHRQNKPRGPSVFFEEVRNDPDSEELTPAAMPEESPLLARLGELAVWPPDPPNRIRRDDAFPDGYPAALDDLLAGMSSAEEHLGRLDPAARLRAQELLQVHRGVALALARAGEDARAPVLGHGAALPRSISATRAAGLLSGKVAPGDLTRPLPRKPSEAARIGVEVHRWIEEQARGLTGLADEEAFDVPAAPLTSDRVRELRDTWLAMGYGQRHIARLDSGEPMAELPFVLKVGDRLIPGRIDAVYETDDGGLEIVDFKTGGRVEVAGLDQLDLYAAALSRLGVAFRGPLILTYCYLASATRESRTITQSEADAALVDVQTRLAQAGAGG